MQKNADKDLPTRRKRLIFRSCHRGIQEMDILLGNFVKLHVENFSHDDCQWFETLFEEADQDIQNWITSKAPVPTEYDCAFMDGMKKMDYIPFTKPI